MSPTNLQSTDAAPVAWRIFVQRLAEGFQFHIDQGGDGVAPAAAFAMAGLQQRDFHDLFGRLALSHGTRRPRTRADATFGAAAGQDLELLLGEPLSPDVLYGYGDPSVHYAAEEGAFYLVVTSNDAPKAFPILRSIGLHDWRLCGFVFPDEASKPAWAMSGHASDFWAPELHRVGEAFWLCFCARQSSGELAVGLARAAGPSGPFIAQPEPLLSGGVIDPHLLVDRARGELFLYWKEDTNGVWPRLLIRLLRDHGELIAPLFPDPVDQRTVSLVQALWPWIEQLEPMQVFAALHTLIEAVTADLHGFRQRLLRTAETAAADVAPTLRAAADAMRTRILAQRIDPSGESLLGDPVTVLENEQPWEAHLVEGPWITQAGGLYHMLYAGNDFSTPEYGIGAAVSDSPLGPFRKQPEPLVRSSDQWWGPGHPSIAIGGDGVARMFLHAYRPGEAGYGVFRGLLTAPLDLTESGPRLRG